MAWFYIIGGLVVFFALLFICLDGLSSDKRLDDGVYKPSNKSRNKK